MQYLVEGARGPHRRREQAIALLEGTVIPFEHVIRLKAEGRRRYCGRRAGRRPRIRVHHQAPSNGEADRIVRHTCQGLLEWKVTPLQSVEARAEMERKVVQALRSAR